jgi:hypothetical protein
MLSVFLIGVAPKEYLHDVLYHHTDTVDPEYKKGEIVITGKHIHCSFLGFAFAPFIATEKQFLAFKEAPCYTHYLQTVYHYHYTSSHPVLSLRGPPHSC